MSTRFLVVPEWQASSSSRAMRLADGAHAIREDLPADATTVVSVPVEAGDAVDTGVNRYTAVAAVRSLARAVLEDLEPPVVTIGGDGAADLAGITHALETHEPERLALVWFSAHADAHSVRTSPTGDFGGMALRAVLGDGPDGLAPATPIPAGNVVLAGARQYDDGEAGFLEAQSIAIVGAEELSAPARLVDAVAATGASHVYLHVDLGVLDPAELAGLAFPEPFGVSVGSLCDAIRALRARLPLAGAGITEFAPGSPDDAVSDLPAILRVLGALTAPPRPEAPRG